MSELVTDEMVTRGALEARKWGVVSKHSEWTNEETQRRCARDILEAAAPLIAAKAWDEGYAEGSRGRMWDSTNPYCADATEPREDHAATDPLDDPAVRLLRDIFVGDPLDEDDHRPRHFRKTRHVHRGDCGYWHSPGFLPCYAADHPMPRTPLAWWAEFGPLTFCDCDATIEAESGATD